jgi:hypothetical protein
MPIMASLVRTHRRLAVVDDDTRRLDFRTVDGSTTISWDGVNVRILASATGLDVPPKDVVRDVVPGLPGSRIRLVKDLEREVFLPMLVTDDDWRGLQARLAQIRALVSFRDKDYVTLEGSFDLVATTDKVERTLRCEYLEGMEGDYGEDMALPEWRRFGMSLLAVNPYWRGEEWSTPIVSLPAANPFLANDGAAHPLRLSTAVAIGLDMPLSIPGDVASSAVVELVGPATTTHITSPSGLDVTIGSLSTGDSFVLDTSPRSRSALLNGVDAWAKVAVSPKWRPIAPGATTMSIVMTGATDESRARVHGSALWETAW